MRHVGDLIRHCMETDTGSGCSSGEWRIPLWTVYSIDIVRTGCGLQTSSLSSAWRVHTSTLFYQLDDKIR